MKIPIAHKSTQRQQRFFFLSMIVLFIPCVLYLDLNYMQFKDGLSRIPDIVYKMLQISFGELPELLAELLTSVIVALLCIVISVLFSFILAFVVAEKTTPNRVLSNVLRAIIVIVRTIPTTIWVLLAVASMGFGPTAGVLGLLFPTVSFLVRVFAAQIDEAGKDTVEAIKAVGGTWWHVVFNGVLPSLSTTFLAMIAFKFEITVAETVILGMVGAGGIGVLLQDYISFYEFAPLMLGVLTVFTTLFLMELITNQIRLRIGRRAR